MALTQESITTQVARLKNKDELLTLGYLRALTRVRKRMQTMQMGGVAENVLGATTLGEQAMDMVRACDDQVAGKREGLDGEVDAWFAQARDESKSLISGAGPQTIEERLLFEQLKTNLRSEFELMFADGNGMAVVRRFGDMKRHADSLTVRGAYDICEALDRQYPQALDYPGVDRTIIAEAQPVERLSEATAAAEQLLNALDEAETEWNTFIRRRGRQAEFARGLLTNERLLDLASVFTDHTMTPYERVLRGGDSVVPEFLLLSQGLIG